MSPTDVPFGTDFREGAVVLIINAEELGLVEIESFGHRLLELAKANLGKRVILDLRHVQSISSVVIGKLFRARKVLLDSGGRLAIVASHPEVRAKLVACDINRILGLYESLDDALAAE